MHKDLSLSKFIDMNEYSKRNYNFFQTPKTDEFPNIEKWEEMDPDEAEKWAVGSEMPPDVSSKDGRDETSETPVGAPTGTVKGTGWPGQNTRFLHVSVSHHRHTRFVHDSIVERNFL